MARCSPYSKRFPSPILLPIMPHLFILLEKEIVTTGGCIGARKQWQ